MQTMRIGADEVARMAALHSRAILDSGRDAAFDELVELASAVCDTPMAAINLIASERQWFKASKGLCVSELPRDVGLCGHAMLGDDLMVVHDALADARFAENPVVSGAPHVRFYAGMPLTTSDGHNIGTLFVIDTRPRELTAAQRVSLRALGPVVMRLIDASATARQRDEGEQDIVETTNSAPVLIWMSGPDKGCIFTNKAWLDFTGRTLEQHFGEGWWHGVHPDDLQRTRGIYFSHFDARRDFRMEYRLRRADGEYRWILETGAPRFDEAGVFQGYIGSCIDLTDRKREQAALLSSETRLRTLVETEPDCVKVVAADGTLLEMNAAGLAMLEADSVRAVNDRGLLNFVAPDYRAAFDALLQRVIGGDGGTMDFEVVGLKGTRRWLHTHAVPMRDADATTLLAITRDVTERRHLERALLKASSREQKKLAYQLHEGLGQDLAGISMLTAALASSAEKGGLPNANQLERLAAMTRQAIATCRDIATGLSPISDANGGLIHGLQRLVTLQRDSYGADVRFEAIVASPIRLRSDVLDHLYRIAQEAVVNAREHASAQLINVTLTVQPTMIRLEILDDGIGLAPDPDKLPGMGLKIMRYRAAMSGARLSIGPGHERGTRVICQCGQAAVS